MSFDRDFTVIPNAYIERLRNLSHGAFRLFVVLRKYMWGKRRVCWPSQNRLSEDMNAKRKMIIQYTTELRRARIIETWRRGRNQTNLYRVNTPKSVTREDDINWSLHNWRYFLGVSNPKHPEVSDSKHPDVSDSALPEVSDSKPETYNNKKTRRKNPSRKTTDKNDLYVSTTTSTRTNPSKVGVSPSTSSHSDSPPADTPTLDEEAFQKIRRHLAENYHLDKGAWSLIVQEILNRKEGPKQLQKCVEDMELRNQVGDRLSNPVGWLISHVKNRYNVGWLYEHKKKIDKAKRYKAGNKISREDIEKTKRELAKYR